MRESIMQEKIVQGERFWIDLHSTIMGRRECYGIRCEGKLRYACMRVRNERSDQRRNDTDAD